MCPRGLGYGGDVGCQSSQPFRHFAVLLLGTGKSLAEIGGSGACGITVGVFVGETFVPQTSLKQQLLAKSQSQHQGIGQPLRLNPTPCSLSGEYVGSEHLWAFRYAHVILERPLKHGLKQPKDVPALFF